MAIKTKHGWFKSKVSHNRFLKYVKGGSRRPSKSRGILRKSNKVNSTSKMNPHVYIAYYEKKHNKGRYLGPEKRYKVLRKRGFDEDRAFDAS